MDLFPKEERKKESSQTQGMKLLEQQGGNRRGKQKQIHWKINLKQTNMQQLILGLNLVQSTNLALLQ